MKFRLQKHKIIKYFMKYFSDFKVKRKIIDT